MVTFALSKFVGSLVNPTYKSMEFYKIEVSGIPSHTNPAPGLLTEDPASVKLSRRFQRGIDRVCI